MARTKQTAKKSTGSKAPRVQPVPQPREEDQDTEMESDEVRESDREQDLRETPSPAPYDDDDEEKDSANSGSDSMQSTANEDESDAGEEGPDVQQPANAEDENLNDHSFRISSKQSYGLDLNKDLLNCLSGKINLAGNPCHFELLPSAPNPCLNIDGLGSIGVPLSSRDGNAISKLANGLKKPKSRTKGANTWTIDAALINFDNPRWTKFLKETVAENVWSGLGIPPYFSPAECVLDKLVLHAPGPVNLPEQSQENEGSVNIVVQLPSAHTGGQVHVSHQTRERDINPAEDPFVTSILASYTSTDLSYTPITDGYRIALVYRLVSTLPNKRLDLPTESLMTLQLQHIFQTWTKGKYHVAPPRKQFTYILEQGDDSLTENQRQARKKEIVSCLQAVTEKFGFTVFSGQLHCHEEGRSDARRIRSNWWEEGEDGDPYDYDEDAMSIASVGDTEITFEDIVDADELEIEGAYMELKSDDIIPPDFFDGVSPDSKEFDVETHTLECDYYRDAILVIPRKKEWNILATANSEYWYCRLEALNTIDAGPLNPREIELALSQVSNSGPKYNRESGICLMKLALKWNDLDLWVKTTQKLGKAVDQHEFGEFVEAFNVFSFERLVPIFESMLLETQSHEKRLGFVRNLEECASEEDREEVTAWVTKYYTNVLVDVTQVSDIIRIGRERGAGFLAQILLPHLVTHPPNINFIHSLYTKLRAKTAAIPDSYESISVDEEFNMTARQLASTCLENVLKQPKYKLYGIQSPRMLRPDDRDIFSRLQTAIRLFLSTGRIQECALPLRLLLHIDSSTYEDCTQRYDELVTQFRGWLTQTKRSITTPPFKHFFAGVIALHMQYLLKFPRPNFDAPIPTFGCGNCVYCQKVDQFLRNRNQSRFDERIYANDRRHIEPFLARLKLAEYHLGPPRGYKPTSTIIHLTLVKYTVERWKSNVNSAKAYLNRIGTGAEVAELMEDEYPKIQESLKGVRAYVASQRFKQALGTVNSYTLEFTTLSPSTDNAYWTCSDNGTPRRMFVLPNKRKHITGGEGPSKKARIDHGIINLTSSP